MALLGAGALVAGYAQTAPKLFGFITTQMYEGEGNSKVMYCIPMSQWMEIVLNDMIGDVVSDIVHRPRLAKIPFQAEMDVGPVRRPLRSTAKPLLASAACLSRTKASPKARATPHLTPRL